jgi:hypothetical protein
MGPQPPPARLTVAALFAQPDNASVLAALGLRRPADVGYFEAGTDGSPFDEGGQVFFHDYGRLVPAAARCALGTDNVLAHERTARIFALHTGRFTVALRVSRLLIGVTLDGPVDLSALGPGWGLLDATDGDAAQAFADAYHQAGTD